jgi:hypothetical protein
MKHYPKINYSFAPKSYLADSDPLAAILRNVKGENRRQMIRHFWDSGKFEELDIELLRDEIGDDARKRLGAIHPSFMGGEYLPGYFPFEVQIARICLESTTSDVISLRAHPTGKAIAYRVVDEYDGVFVLPIPESERPLTLAELIRQLDEGQMKNDCFPNGGLSLGYNNLNADASDRERLRYFTSISSDVYTQLNAHYERVFDDWVAGNLANNDRETAPPHE